MLSRATPQRNLPMHTDTPKARSIRRRLVLLPLLTALALSLIPTIWFATRRASGEPIPPVFLPKLDEPTRVIFDTDMGNDIDDALALGMLHALESRNECRLLAITISKDNAWCAPFCDAVNTFYRRGEIPIATVTDGKTPQDSRYVRGIVEASDGTERRYPYDLPAPPFEPDAVRLLRRCLAEQPDQSVVIVVVGFSTNLARLLESEPDEYSSDWGNELVRRKCRFLSMMAGMFTRRPDREFNVVQDVASAAKVFGDWPTAIAISGYEIGLAVRFSARSIERDFRYVRHHPLREAYMLYKPMPYDQETWDLTSVLFAIRPDRGYFQLSRPGSVHIDDRGLTRFNLDRAGRHRYLLVDSRQAVRVQEALEQLVSQPPGP